jgi:WD40 repeat protein
MSENKPAELPKLDFQATHGTREWKHSAQLLGCRFDPTGRYVFASSFDFTIQRWDLQEDQHATFAGHQSWLRGLGFSNDGQFLYSAGYEGKLCFWEATTSPAEEPFKPIREIQAHDGWVRWLAVHPDGKLIATAGNDVGFSVRSLSECARSMFVGDFVISVLLELPACHAGVWRPATGVVSGRNVARI